MKEKGRGGGGEGVCKYQSAIFNDDDNDDDDDKSSSQVQLHKEPMACSTFSYIHTCILYR